MRACDAVELRDYHMYDVDTSAGIGSMYAARQTSTTPPASKAQDNCLAARWIAGPLNVCLSKLRHHSGHCRALPSGRPGEACIVRHNDTRRTRQLDKL